MLENHRNKGICLDIFAVFAVVAYQGRCWPNGFPKQECIVVTPSLKYYGSEKKLNTYYRGQNKTLIKYTSKNILIQLYYLLITIVVLDRYLWL